MRNKWPTDVTLTIESSWPTRLSPHGVKENLNVVQKVVRKAVLKVEQKVVLKVLQRVLQRVVQRVVRKVLQRVVRKANVIRLLSQPAG